MNFSIKLFLKEQMIKFQMALRNMTLFSKIFIGFNLIEGFVVLLGAIGNIVTNVVRSLNPETPSYSSLMLTIALIIGLVIVLYMAFDSVLQENEFQLIGFILVTLIITVGVSTNFGYKIFTMVKDREIFLNEEADISYKISFYFQISYILSCIFVVVVCQVLYLVLVIPVFKGFGWNMFKIVGTNPVLLKYYKIYLIFVTLIKSDTALNVLVLFLGFSLFKPDVWNYIGLFLCLVFSMIVTPVSYVFGVQRENYIIHIIFIIWGLCGNIYYIYSVIHFLVAPEQKLILEVYSWRVDRNTVKLVLSLVMISAVLFRCFSQFFAVWVCINFRKGLKTVFQNQSSVKQSLQLQQAGNSEMISIESLLGPDFKVEDVQESDNPSFRRKHTKEKKKEQFGDTIDVI